MAAICAQNTDGLKNILDIRIGFEKSKVPGHDDSYLRILGTISQDKRRQSGTFPCDRPCCVTYAHFNASRTSRHPGWSTEIRSQVHLHDQQFSCHKFSTLYVGETGRRLGDRFREHIRSVGANTDPSVDKHGKHFSSPGHGVNNMQVSVICAGFRITIA